MSTVTRCSFIVHAHFFLQVAPPRMAAGDEAGMNLVPLTAHLACGHSCLCHVAKDFFVAAKEGKEAGTNDHHRMSHTLSPARNIQVEKRSLVRGRKKLPQQILIRSEMTGWSLCCSPHLCLVHRSSGDVTPAASTIRWMSPRCDPTPLFLPTHVLLPQIEAILVQRTAARKKRDYPVADDLAGLREASARPFPAYDPVPLGQHRADRSVPPLTLFFLADALCVGRGFKSNGSVVP